MSDNNLVVLPSKKKEVKLEPVENVVVILEELLKLANEGKVVELAYSVLFRDETGSVSPSAMTTINMIGSSHQYAQHWALTSLHESYNDQIHLSNAGYKLEDD